MVEDGILQVINVSHGDQGVYTCVARTPVDQDVASALLMVLGELSHVVRWPKDSTDMFSGALRCLTVALKCPVDMCRNRHRRSHAARCTSSGSRDDWIERFVPSASVLVSHCTDWLCPMFSKPVLWRFSDVPDAPEHLLLSEHKGKSVKLKWIPGDDHNSSVTGKRVCPSSGVGARSLVWQVHTLPTVRCKLTVVLIPSYAVLIYYWFTQAWILIHGPVEWRPRALMEKILHGWLQATDCLSVSPQSL